MKAIEAINVTKVYPNGVVANRNVNFSATVGEIHAVVGENGRQNDIDEDPLRNGKTNER
jgi:ABC-type uncharacterized transport system ATPase subunit